MDQPLLRRRVNRMLADGRLPLTSISSVCDAPGNGHVGDACDGGAPRA